MKRPADHWKDWLVFSRSEQRGLLILLTLSAVIVGFRGWVLPRLAGTPEPLQITLIHPDQEPIAGTSQEPNEDSGFTTLPGKVDKTVRPFRTDTMDAADWHSLGLSEKQAQAVARYAASSGGFRSAEDLSRVRVIPDHLRPLILDAAVFPGGNPSPSAPGNGFAAGPQARAEPSATARSVRAPLELNSADTLALQDLPGIGAFLARMIAEYRDRLGGFVRVDQLSEVWRMRPETVELLRNKVAVDASLVRTIDINAASTERLGRHPYIGFTAAKAIVAYREKHGPFNAPEDLLESVVVDEAMLARIRPYLAAFNAAE